MSTTIAFDPRRFRTAAEYYLRGRLDYPEELIRRVAAASGLRPDERVLDLGCGPGLLARSFAPLVREVVAIDPEPEMLRVAEAHLADGAIKNVKLYRGSSYDLGDELGAFKLVVMGRSFHWMDRAATLTRLATLTPPDGAVALFADRHPDGATNAWDKRFHEIVDPVAETDIGRITRKDPDWLSHDAVLAGSPFAHVQKIVLREERKTPVEALIDRALSMSSCSPARLGDGLEAFVARLTDALRPFATSGHVTEVVDFEAMLARRRPAE